MTIPRLAAKSAVPVQNPLKDTSLEKLGKFLNKYKNNNAARKDVVDAFEISWTLYYTQQPLSVSTTNCLRAFFNDELVEVLNITQVLVLVDVFIENKNKDELILKIFETAVDFIIQKNIIEIEPELEIIQTIVSRFMDYPFGEVFCHNNYFEISLPVVKLADYYKENNRTENAINLLKSAKSALTPDESDKHWANCAIVTRDLATLYYEGGNIGEAVELLISAIKEFNDEHSCMQLADIYMEQLQQSRNDCGADYDTHVQTTIMKLEELEQLCDTYGVDDDDYVQVKLRGLYDSTKIRDILENLGTDYNDVFEIDKEPESTNNDTQAIATINEFNKNEVNYTNDSELMPDKDLTEMDVDRIAPKALKRKRENESEETRLQSNPKRYKVTVGKGAGNAANHADNPDIEEIGASSSRGSINTTPQQGRVVQEVITVGTILKKVNIEIAKDITFLAPEIKKFVKYLLDDKKISSLSKENQDHIGILVSRGIGSDIFSKCVIFHKDAATLSLKSFAENIHHLDGLIENGYTIAEISPLLAKAGLSIGLCLKAINEHIGFFIDEFGKLGFTREQTCSMLAVGAQLPGLFEKLKKDFEKYFSVFRTLRKECYFQPVSIKALFHLLSGDYFIKVLDSISKNQDTFETLIVKLTCEPKSLSGMLSRITSFEQRVYAIQALTDNILVFKHYVEEQKSPMKDFFRFILKNKKKVREQGLETYIEQFRIMHNIPAPTHNRIKIMA